MDDSQPEHELQSLLIHNTSQASWKILEQIRRYRSISPGSLTSYLYPLGVAGINFTTLYLGYILKGILNKFGEHDMDNQFFYVRAMSITAGGLLMSAPLCKGAYYLGKRWYHHSQIAMLIQKSMSPSETRLVLQTLKSNPSEGMRQLGIPEQDIHYIEDYQSFLRRRPMLNTPDV